MHVPQGPRRSITAWQRYRWPAAAAVLGLVLTGVAYMAAAGLAERQAVERFEFRALQIHDAVGRRLEGYTHILRGGASLYDATRHVTRDMWRTYVDGLALPETFPGFQGVGYSTRIPAERLAEHEARVRADGFPDYRVHPEHPRAEYHSIVYLEPFDWRNRRAFGYDMFTEPTRRAAMERARDTGTSAMSGQVVLVQETDEDVQAGFLIYHPVYRPEAPTTTVAERREALMGFVYSPVRMDNLLRGVLGGQPIGVDFEIYDRQPAPGNLMYASSAEREAASTPPRRFSTVSELSIAGHTWTLVFLSTPEFEVVLDRWRPLLILLVGLLISALLFAAVSAAQARRLRDVALSELNARLEQRVAERTAQLEFANRELEAFAYSVSHDLRGPLRAIAGFSERLAGEPDDGLSADGRHYLSRIQAGVGRMRQLIDDLLALSRVARSRVHRVDVDLSGMARDILADLKASDPARDVRVVVADTPPARGDARLLRIALENLLGNAWKFTGRTAAACIEFGAAAEDGTTVYFVRDNGAGFDPAYAKQLFRPFQRLHRESEFPGTGIGLATVARIIERHGGTLRADAAVNRGAVIYFSIGA